VEVFHQGKVVREAEMGAELCVDGRFDAELDGGAVDGLDGVIAEGFLFGGSGRV
jgi:hypothetical protein